MATTLTAAAEDTRPKLAIVSTRSFLHYLGIAFGLTWMLVGLAVLIGHGIIALPIPATVLITLGTLGPMVAAIYAVASESGRTGVRTLLAQLRRWRARPVWYAVALLGPALGMGIAWLLSLALGGPRLPAPPLSAWLSTPILIVALLIPAMCEEVGWRGYALPRLQQRFGAVWASSIVGVIWACWHIPIWFIPGAGFAQQPFALFALMTIAYAILFAWLYNSSGGCLPLVILAHAAVNASFVPWGAALNQLPAQARGMAPQIPISLTFALLALLVVLLTRPRTLTRDKRPS